MKIYAPVKTATGTWASVRFVNGVGETDNPNLIKWFKKNGYRVEEEIQFDNLVENDQIETENDQIENGIPDLENMTPNEIRDWARCNGYNDVIRNIRNKARLIELIRGE